MTKSRVSQELRNGYPDWTKIRKDDQSVGASFLNVIGNRLELLATELVRGLDNQFLTTAFTGELDNLYKVDLPSNFVFNVDNTNKLSPVVQSPTISGLFDGNWIDVTEVNSVRDLWYDAVPSRITEIATYNIDSTLVASGVSSDIELQIVASGLELDNYLTVSVDSDDALIAVDSNNQVQRSKVRITGTTWKDTDETEDVVFIYSDTKPTFKAWNNITKIEPTNFVSDASINVYSHAFNLPVYLDGLGTISQFPEGRENLPYFWALSTTEAGYSVLELQKYASEKAVELLTIKPSFVTYKRWELLTASGVELAINDIAPAPYQKRIFAVDDTNLYIFDTEEELPNLKVLDQKTSNSLVDINTSSDYFSRSDEVEVSLLFQRPIKTIIRHRLKVEYPDGATFGVMANGSLVPTTSDYFVYGEVTDRFIRPSVFVQLDDVGQYNFTLEVVYFDESTDIAQRAVLVSVKEPLQSFDLLPFLDHAVGIDIDHQNRLLILDSDNTIHHLNLHYDLSLIDYDKKQILLRENYSEVKVIK